MFPQTFNNDINHNFKWNEISEANKTTFMFLKREFKLKFASELELEQRLFLFSPSRFQPPPPPPTIPHICISYTCLKWDHFSLYWASKAHLQSKVWWWAVTHLNWPECVVNGGSGNGIVWLNVWYRKKTFQPQLEADAEPALMDVLKHTAPSRLIGHTLLPMKRFKVV